jgi:hypothetical protein
MAEENVSSVQNSKEVSSHADFQAMFQGKSLMYIIHTVFGAGVAQYIDMI